MFEEELLKKLNLTEEEVELIVLLHPNFEGIPIDMAATYFGVSRSTLYRRLVEVYKKYPELKTTMEESKEEAKQTRLALKNMRRLGELEGLETGDDDLILGEKIVRKF